MPPAATLEFAEEFENWVVGGVWAYGRKTFLGKLFSMEVLDKKDVSCNFLRKAMKGVQPIASWIQVVGDGDHVDIMALRRLG